MKMRIASLSLLTVCCLMLAVAPAMASTLYSNGLCSPGASCDSVDGWTINFGFTVSDSYTLIPGAGTTVNDIHFAYWDSNSTDLLSTVDAAFTFVQNPTSGFHTLGGGGAGGTLTNSTLMTTNQYGYGVYQANITGLNIDLSLLTTGFMTLGNACTSQSGCSVSTPIYWDENSGPSSAFENTIGSIPSEQFTLTGSGGLTTPEPSSIMLFGSGILGLAGVLRRKLNI